MSVINTNITSMIGQQNLNKSQSALQTSMERLSSGLRINSAKDDAAGQAIANRMSAQITGLSTAQRNANDGISVAQTAEGGLNQINDNLQRIRELAVQAENGTNSQNDLDSIQNEINQRLSEINRISEETDFNGTKVLGASSETDPTQRTVRIQVGAEDGQTIDIELSQINQETLNLAGFNVNGSGAIDNVAATADDLVLGGFEEVGNVDGSRQFERDTVSTNVQAGASDVISLMSEGDTVNVSGLNNGLGDAVGDSYTLNADGNFTFDVNNVASGDAASFLKPGSGETATLNVNLGGGNQTIRVNSDGNVTNTDGDTLYMANDGTLTSQNSDGLNAATIDGIAARLSAASTAMPTVNETTPGTNESYTIDLSGNIGGAADGTLAAGESITIGGLTLTADGAAVTAGALVTAFNDIVNNGATAAANIAISGEFDSANFSLATAGADSLTVTSTNTGDPADVNVQVLGAAAAAGTTYVAGSTATATTTSVVFSSLTDGQSVTVGDVTFTASGNVTSTEAATAFEDYFNNGSPAVSGTFEPVSGTEADLYTATRTNNDVVFTRNDLGALNGPQVTGTFASVDTTEGSDAVTNNTQMTMAALDAGESFTVTNGLAAGAGGFELTFTAAADGMTGADVAAEFEALISGANSQTELDAAIAADDRFSGSFNFAGDEGWSVESRSGADIVFSNTSTADDPTSAAQLTGSSITAAANQASVTTNAAVAAETEITFDALEVGQAITVDGLTLTAQESMSSEQVARAFEEQIGQTAGYQGEQAAFTGALENSYNVSLTDSTLTLTNLEAGAITTEVSTPSAIANGSITAGDTTFTSNNDGTFDVSGATISADALAQEGQGSAYDINIAAGDNAGVYSVAATGGVSLGGNLQYLSTATGDLTTEEDETTTETLFAHQKNGNVTDSAGNIAYKDAEGEITMEAQTEGQRTENALGTLDAALSTVDALRSDLGAIQNRMESAIENLSTTETNLSAARSRIEDADYAVEVASMTRSQILQQAGTSVLAQANQLPQNVLSLLG